MKRWIIRGLAGAVALAAAIGLFVFFVFLPPRVDARLNVVLDENPPAVSDAARALHGTLAIADLHADTFLWGRDPARRQTRGHTDIPRLVEGGVSVQVFSAVTKSPRNLNYDRNAADSDDITALVIAQRWPVATWFSLAERALHQARRLEDVAKRSGGAVRLVRTRADLDAALDAGALAALLATEGAHPLEGKIETLARLDAAGYRMIGLHHFFDNELGGSLHGLSGAGLTDFGRAVIAEAERRGMIIDVAHSSVASVRDALAVATRPVVVSHTGLKGHCDTARNLPDGLMLEIAAKGGLIGVGFWDGAVCDPTPASIAAAIAYAVRIVGPDHVALGSDFDGVTHVPFDAAGYARLTEALLAEGLDEKTIRAVMGANTIRFLRAHLPAAP